MRDRYKWSASRSAVGAEFSFFFLFFSLLDGCKTRDISKKEEKYLHCTEKVAFLALGKVVVIHYRRILALYEYHNR